MSARSASGSRPASSIDPPWTDRLPHTINFGPNVPPVRRSQTALARRFYQMCMGIQAEALATTDLTALQFAVIAILNRQNGEPGIDQNSLAARLGVERSHASLLVEELVTQRLIEQRVNGADRRARVLSLTPKGEKLYERVRPSIRAANERVLGPLSPHERELFKDMLIRMIGANGAYARPGAGRRKRSSRQSSSGGRTPSRKSIDIDGGTS